MSISNITKFAAKTAGENSAINATHTCAGTDPIVLDLLKSNPDVQNRPDYLMEIAENWDLGYMAMRAKLLASLNDCNNNMQLARAAQADKR